MVRGHGQKHRGFPPKRKFVKVHRYQTSEIDIYIIGSYVLSNAMDNTLRVWDVRPFVTTDRCVKIMTGHKHNFEKVNFLF